MGRGVGLIVFPAQRSLKDDPASAYCCSGNQIISGKVDVQSRTDKQGTRVDGSSRASG